VKVLIIDGLARGQIVAFPEESAYCRVLVPPPADIGRALAYPDEAIDMRPVVYHIHKFLIRAGSGYVLLRLGSEKAVEDEQMATDALSLILSAEAKEISVRVRENYDV